MPALAETPATSPIDLNRIDALERVITDNLEPIEIEPVHRFADGIYSREITIPAGVMLTGKVHKTRHLNIISKGKIQVYDEFEGSRIIEAPCSFVAEPGTRRAGFAIEETVWTTIHATHETDLQKLEAELIVKHDNPLLAPRQLEAQS